jgi:hypothetical protein
MFWSKKDKNQKDKKQEKASAKKEESPAEKSARLREEAMKNMRAAREQIGEETLDRIAAAMLKKQQSAIEQAKNQIKSTDTNKVADELRWMLEDKKKT